MATPPIDGAEILYRQVGYGGTPIYFDPDRNPCLWTNLFLPTNGDTDGLSLIRASFRCAQWSALRLTKPDIRYRLAQLIAAETATKAIAAGMQTMTFVSSPDDLDDQHGEPHAHCVASQVNINAYKTNHEAKRAIKEWAHQVANSINREDILGPFPVPPDDYPYRP